MRRTARIATGRAFGAAAVGIAANAVRLRSRVRRLAVLDTGPPTDRTDGSGPSAGVDVGSGATADRTDRSGPSAGMGAVAGAGDASSRSGATDVGRGFRVVTAAGVSVDDATVAAAVRHAEAHVLDVVDLVPGDLPSSRLIELATHLDPGTYRADPLAIGWGAGHATVVRVPVLERVAAGESEGRPPTTGLDPVAYLRLARQLKRYAPTSTDLAVAPRLTAVEPHPSWRLPYLRALLGVAAPVLAPAPALGAGLMALGPVAGGRGGVAALAAYLLEPRVVAAGGPVRPRDLGKGAAVATAALSRPWRDVMSVLRPLFVSPPAAVRAHADRLAAEDRDRRQVYAADAARAGDFFEPRRTTCPWCGSADIALLHELPDLIQGKPGRFRLDECRACTHVFQNPRLSPAGLDHYYRDFYDGLQAEHTELLFSFTGDAYVGRARMLERVAGPAGDAAGPKRWLDVGTGHGHFCLVARGIWPGTRFDGLDMTDSIDEAQRRGWVEQGHRGLFPDLAADLAGGYDVVSMHHYLEHTREPGRELDAAHTVLEAGGHLLIELPAPESPLGRRLGWLWGPWFQPQHQHLVPLANLIAALRKRGFGIVAVERHEAHQPVDLVFAVMLLAMRLAPAGSAPWDPPPRRLRQVARAAVFTSLLPLAGAAMVGDQALRPVVRARPELTNTYRVLARKD